jgi:hypothetical protein
MKKTKQIKMNLTLPVDFYEVLKLKSREDYMRPSSWTRRFLMMNLLGDKKSEKFDN